MENENTECIDCDELAMEDCEYCDACAEHREEPWHPQQSEDGGYFGWAGMTEA